MLSVVFGALIGFSLGLLGGGGSILTVPILVYAIGLDVHAATGTSLAIVGTSALLGAIAHARKGNVRLRLGLAFGAFSMLGTVPGVWLNRLVAARVILLLFGGLMGLVGICMVRREQGGRRARPELALPAVFPARDWIRFSGLGASVGVLTGFFGIGGGFMIMPALGLVGGLIAHHAVGTSLLVIAMTSGAGLAGHLWSGTVDPPVIGVFVVGGAVGILSGTRLAGSLPERTLAKTFGWVVILLALSVIAQNLGVLTAGLR